MGYQAPYQQPQPNLQPSLPPQTFYPPPQPQTEKLPPKELQYVPITTTTTTTTTTAAAMRSNQSPINSSTNLDSPYANLSRNNFSSASSGSGSTNIINGYNIESPDKNNGNIANNAINNNIKFDSQPLIRMESGPSAPNDGFGSIHQFGEELFTGYGENPYEETRTTSNSASFGNTKHTILLDDDDDDDPFGALYGLPQTEAKSTQKVSNSQNNVKDNKDNSADAFEYIPKPKEHIFDWEDKLSNKKDKTTINDLLLTGQIIIPLDDFTCDICCEYTCMQFFQQELQTLGCFPGDFSEFRSQCPAIQLSTCLHTFCLTCIKDHVENYIIYQLPQADVKRIPCLECTEWITQQELRTILNPDDYDKFEKNQFEWSLLGNSNIYKCITPNCANIIEKSGALIADPRLGGFNPRFHCDECHVTQCVSCLVPWHANKTCKEYKAFIAEQEALKSSDLLSNAQDFNMNSSQFRQCPQCHIMIERAYGCAKVKCLCGYGMCFICGSAGAKCKCTGTNHVFFDNKTGRGTRDITNQQ
jgi:hypothetical protein